MDFKIGLKQFFNKYSLKIKGLKNKFLDKLLKKATDIMNIPVPTTHDFLSDKDFNKIKAVLKPGDIILTANDRYPGWAIAEKMLLNSDWSHTGVYVGEGKVVDAESAMDFSGVEKISLEEFLLSRHHAIVLRPKFKTKEDKKAFLDYVNSSIGKPYDDAFDSYDDSALYCTELPYQAFKHIDFDTSDFAPKKTIIGKDIVSGSSYVESKNLETVYTTGNNFWKNQLSHLPFIAKAFLKGGLTASISSIFLPMPVSLVIGGLVSGYQIGKDMQKIKDEELTPINYPVVNNSNSTKDIE